MKKLLSLILSLALLAGTALIAVPASAEEPYNIVFAYPASGDLHRSDVISKLLSDYTQEKIGCTVTLMPISFANWNQKMNLMLASSGEKLDVMTCLTGNFSGYVAKNQLQDMTELLDKYFPEYEQEYGSALLSCGTVGGKVLGLPTIKYNASGLGLYFSRELVDELNLDLSTIHTLSDITPMLAAAKEAHPDMYPLALDNSGYGVATIPGTDRLSNSLGVLLNCTESTTIVNPYASEEYYAYLLQAYEWYEAEYISPDALSNSVFVENEVKENRALCCLTTNFSIYAENDTDIYYVQVNQPVSTSDDMAFTVDTIPHNCKNPEKAMEFIKLLYTDSYVLDLIAWGEEGSDYARDENGQVYWPDGTDFNAIYVYGAGFMIGSDYNTSHMQDYPVDYIDQLKAYNESAPLSKAAGFMFDSTKVTTQISALNNVTAEFLGVLETGMVHPDDLLPDFLKKLEQAGINEVIAEKQAQLDDWLASK